MLNIFRLSADLLHLASIVILLLKIYATKNTKGVSLKTQILFLAVFCMRYLDIFTNWRIPYNVVMKILFLILSSVTVYWIAVKYNKGYDKEHDTFRIVFLLVPALAAAVITPKPDPYSVMDTLWTTSIYLEAVAILPQLFLIRRTGEVENITSHYIAAMGAYRFLYMCNWVYRYYTEEGYYHIPGNFIVWASGFVQTALYVDFFFYFFRSKWYGQKFMLPGSTTTV